MKIYSFDIFDTLITRDLASPKEQWSLLQSEILIKWPERIPIDFASDFKAIRQAGEIRANRETDNVEVSLDDIYHTIHRYYPKIDVNCLNEIKELEEALELTHCYGIRANVQCVLKLIEQQQRVILISDMYLSAATIRSMLAKAHPQLRELPLYLSSELQARKTNGALFEHVCQAEQVTADQIQHLGDNFFSDYISAKKRGLHASHYRDSELTEIERSYYTKSNGTTAALIAGASKKARLTAEAPSPSYLLGATYTGPFFYGFVYDTIQQAKSRGIETLYFFARDGFLLLEIAKKILEQQPAPLQLEYLHVSRQSVYLASITTITERNLTPLFEDADNGLSVQKMARRLNLTVDDLIRILSEAELTTSSNTSEHDRLCAKTIQRLRERIETTPTLKQTIEAAAVQPRERLLAYLTDKNVTTHSRIGVVDVGWRASTQDALYRLLKPARPDLELTGFYYGCLGYSDHTSQKNLKLAYHITPSNRPSMAPLIELLMQADHGTTLRYEFNATGQIAPVLKEQTPSAANWSIEDYLSGIVAFAQQACTAFTRYPALCLNYRGIDTHLLARLEDGDAFIATVIGDLPYSSKFEEDKMQVIAPPFSLLDAIKYLISTQARRRAMTQWYQGSLARSHRLVKILLAIDPRKHLITLVKDITTRDELRSLYFRIRKCFPFR